MHYFEWFLLAIGAFPLIRIHNDKPLHERQDRFGMERSCADNVRINPV